MRILGLSAYGHDSAACLFQDGRVVSAARQEWFEGPAVQSSLPLDAVNFCLQYGNVTADDLDYAVFYKLPFLEFNRAVSGHLYSWPFSFKRFLGEMPDWLKDRLILPLVLKRDLAFEKPVLFVKHHLSHAAGAFLFSPFEDAAVITADGAGEWASLACGKGEGKDIRVLREIRYPDSLGLLYSAVTSFLGYQPGEEFSVMDMAGAGHPDYVEDLRRICNVRPDGSFRIEPGYFCFNRDSSPLLGKFIKLFGAPRKPGEGLQPRHYAVAASLQQFLEEVLVLIASNLRRETGCENLCLGGGVFSNTRAVAAIAENSGFKRIYLQPDSGNASCSLGAAAYIYHSLLGNPRVMGQSLDYLGPAYTATWARRVIMNSGLRLADEEGTDHFYHAVCEVLSGGGEVAWFQGRMGLSRDLPAGRCILNAPESAAGKIAAGCRFIPLVREESAGEFFRVPAGVSGTVLQARINRGDIIPGAECGCDMRIRIVRRSEEPATWSLLSFASEKYGIPFLLGTCLCSKQKTAVCSPEQAIEAFKRSNCSLLVLDNFLVRR